MRITIAGGNGFIGRELTGQLVHDGHEVTWLSHRPGRASRPAGVREMPFTLHRGDEWWSEVAGCDGVVNLSGYPIASRWSSKVKRLLVESRIQTGRALADAIADARAAGDGPSVLVSASGIGYYGDADDELVTEDSPPGEDWLAQLAAAWERAAEQSSASGCRVVIVRTGLVLGDEGLVPRMALPMKLFAGGPVGTGRQWVPWIHIEDIAGVYKHALTEASLTGPVNAVAPESLRMRDFAKAMGRVLGRPSWFPVPGFMLRIVLGEVARYTLFSQRASADKLRASGFAFRHPEVEEALASILLSD